MSYTHFVLTLLAKMYILKNMAYDFNENLKQRYGISINEYARIHRWLIKKYGNATKCENKKCKKYEMKRNNFKMLCGSCHVLQDKVKVWY